MAFILGILASFFALLAQGMVWIFHPELFTFTSPLETAMLVSLFFLALTEEAARALFSYQYLKRYVKHHVWWGALFFALGFASLEVVLTFWNGFSWAVFGASGFHILATFLVFWWLKENASRFGLWVLVTLLTLLHTFFNLALLSGMPSI